MRDAGWGWRCDHGPEAAGPSRWRATALAAGLLAGAASCTHQPLRSEAGVCPEYRDLRCATAPECSLDEARGCRVCQCGPPPAAGTGGVLPSAVPPDLRHP